MKIAITFEGPAGPVEAVYELEKPGVGYINRTAKQLSQNPIGAMKSLVLSCMSEADKERFIADSEEYPGIITSLGNRLLDNAGFNADVTVKN